MPEPRRRIFDVHLHVYSSDPRWDARTANPITGAPLAATDEKGHRAEILRIMERRGVTTAAILDGSRDPGLVERWCAEASMPLLIGYGFDDPAGASLDWYREQHARGMLDVIGEIGAAYAGLPLNHPRLDPWYALAEELGVPLAIHGGTCGGWAAYAGAPGYRMDLVDPLLLEEVLLRHRDLKLWLMHAGWPFSDRTVALMHAHPRVFVDIGVIAWSQTRAEFHSYLRRLVDAGFGDRIMWGSDAMVWTDTIELAIDAVESAPFLSEQDKAAIFYGNAARFFGLPA